MQILCTKKEIRSIVQISCLNFSGYGSVMFNFGTVLVMLIIRSTFPDNSALRLAIGLSSSAVLLLIGRQYIQHIDRIFDAIPFQTTTHS